MDAVRTCALSALTGLLLPPYVLHRLFHLSGGNEKGCKDASQHVAGRTSTFPLRAFTVAILMREQADTPIAHCPAWYV